MTFKTRLTNISKQLHAQGGPNVTRVVYDAPLPSYCRICPYKTSLWLTFLLSDEKAVDEPTQRSRDQDSITTAMSTTQDGVLPTSVLPPTTLSSFIALHPEQTSSTTTSSSTLVPNEAQKVTYPNTKPQEALNMHTRRNNQLVETRTTKPTLMTRLKGRNANSRTVKTTTKIEPRSAVAGYSHTHNTRRSGFGHSTRHNEPVVHHKRHATMGDKVSGALMKLRGTLTRRPGLKAAGTRRMHGTDGRGSHRTY